MKYPVETLTDAERDRLRPHVTNLDRPVFALVNLPETVKGALFARYSRYPGTLRRLFLDEFAEGLSTPRPTVGPTPRPTAHPTPGATKPAATTGDEGERAAQ